MAVVTVSVECLQKTEKRRRGEENVRPDRTGEGERGEETRWRKGRKASGRIEEKDKNKDEKNIGKDEAEKKQDKIMR